MKIDLRTKGCDVCHDDYWIEDMSKVGNYDICKECIDFVEQGLECTA